MTDKSVWPNAAGTTGITSVSKLRAAQAAGKAFPDVPTNFLPLLRLAAVPAERKRFDGRHEHGRDVDEPLADLMLAR